IDPNRCKHCGACARMCVTQALEYHVDDERRATLTFRPSLCVNCRLCRDSCISHSMIYSTSVPAADLAPGVVKTLFKDEELPQKGSPRIGL
ncbi:MAG: ATP-binding protein, partial [Bacteroidales bacterium]